MRHILTLIISSVVVITAALVAKHTIFEKNLEINSKILEIATPLSGRINIDFLKESFESTQAVFQFGR